MTNSTQSGFDGRWTLIRNLHRRFKNFYRLLSGLSLGAVVLLLGAFIFIGSLGDFSMNAFTEIFGIIVTIFFVDQLNQIRAEQRRKEELLIELRSKHNAVSTRAALILMKKWWLYDGALEGASLRDANLQGAKLWGVHMRGAYCSRANFRAAEMPQAKLQEAIFIHANLCAANLTHADLRGADLSQANLKGANLQYANLRGANLHLAKLDRANLEGADLRNANLQNASLGKTQFLGADLRGANLRHTDLENATLMVLRIYETFEPFGSYDDDPMARVILPDGTKLKFGDEIDLARFTDPDHPDFWNPDEHRSDD